jgi:glycosyltransferase involved in cell wall biosynthesis
LKIVFFISVFKEGSGGHYYSLVTTANALKKSGLDVEICQIGLNKSPVISSLISPEIRVRYFYTSIFLVPLVAIKIFFLYRGKDIVLHPFDEYAYFFSRMISPKIILTKCGGGNSKIYFPGVDDIIVYSKENYNNLLALKKWKNIYLLPNRVSPFLQDEQNCKILRKECAVNIIFMRITRIGDYYKKSIQDSISLVKKLNQEGVQCKLLVVGVVYENDVYLNLRKKGGEHVVWKTDPNYTINAKRLISSADFFIGTGRSIMEAMYAGCAVLTPVSGRKYPELVTEKNIESFMATNFSERNNPSLSESGSISSIIELCKNPYKLKEQRALVGFFFSKYFDISNVIENYIDIYKKVQKVQKGRKIFFSIDLVFHFFKVVIYIIKCHYRKI